MATCIRSNLRTIYLERHDRYEALLVKALAYYDFLMDAEGMEAMKFDSGESMSWAKYTDPAEFLTKVINPIEAQIDLYRNKYNGTGIVKLNLRRNRGSCV